MFKKSLLFDLIDSIKLIFDWNTSNRRTTSFKLLIYDLFDERWRSRSVISSYEHSFEDILAEHIQKEITNIIWKITPNLTIQQGGSIVPTLA